MKIDVADISADQSRACQTDLRIQVRTVHIDESAVVVNNTANFLDAFFKNTVRRRVRYHQCGERLLILYRLRLKIVCIDIAVRIACDDDHLHSGHNRAGRIRAVCGCRNKNNRALFLTMIAVIGAYDHQSRKFSLRAGIRLQ